jgi:dethiobiotin synthase
VNGLFVTGTDTDVGKTLVSSWLLTQLDASYWKPVQAGVMPETDSSVVRRLAEIEPDRILPEAYVLPEAIAPHEAARRAGIAIDMAKFVPPVSDRLLVVEGAGGLMVPLTDTAYVIDLAAELHLPLILVARSTLGTINHTRYGQVEVIAEIPWLDVVNRSTLLTIEPELDLMKLARS